MKKKGAKRSPASPKKSDGELKNIARPIVLGLAKYLSRGNHGYDVMKSFVSGWVEQSKSASPGERYSMAGSVVIAVSYAMEGDLQAYRACLELAAKCLVYGVEMPHELETLVARLCQREALSAAEKTTSSAGRRRSFRRARKGGDKYINIDRNIVIADTIRELSRLCGISRTRASAIAADLLDELAPKHGLRNCGFTKRYLADITAKSPTHRFCATPK